MVRNIYTRQRSRLGLSRPFAVHRHYISIYWIQLVMGSKVSDQNALIHRLILELTVNISFKDKYSHDVRAAVDSSHVKTWLWVFATRKSQIRLHVGTVISDQESLDACQYNLQCLMILKADNAGSDQPARMRRLIRAFAVRICPECPFPYDTPFWQMGWYRGTNRNTSVFHLEIIFGIVRLTSAS